MLLLFDADIEPPDSNILTKEFTPAGLGLNGEILVRNVPRLDSVVDDFRVPLSEPLSDVLSEPFSTRSSFKEVLFSFKEVLLLGLERNGTDDDFPVTFKAVSFFGNVTCTAIALVPPLEVREIGRGAVFVERSSL